MAKTSTARIREDSDEKENLGLWSVPRRLTRSVSRSNMHSSGYVRVRLGIWLPLCIRTRAEGFSQPERWGALDALYLTSTPFPAAHRWAVRFPPQADRSRNGPDAGRRQPRLRPSGMICDFCLGKHHDVGSVAGRADRRAVQNGGR